MKYKHSYFIILLSILLLPVLLFIVPSCVHEPLTLDGIDTVCFDTKVLPVLQTSCGMTGCHGSGSSRGEFSVADYASVMRAVDPGNPVRSRLYKVITDINSDNMMPPNQPLNKTQRTLIQVWIAQGAKNTVCGTNTPTGGIGDTTGTTYKDSLCFAQNILPVIQSSCATTGCHDQTTHREGYVFTDYASIMTTVNPYNPGGSKLYRVMTTGESDERMPPAGSQQLTSQQIDNIRKWIAEGAVNSDCPQASCDTTGTISFATQVWPAFQNNCTGCHNSSLSSGNISLDSYQNIKKYAETLRNGTPLIVGAIRHKSGFIAMPPSGTLDECTIRKIELWIAQGKLNN